MNKTIIEFLNEHGYVAEIKLCDKGDIKKEAIVVRRPDENVGAILYTDFLNKAVAENGLDNTLEQLIHYVEKSLIYGPSQETVEAIISREGFEQNILVGLERICDTEFIHRPLKDFQGLQEYMYIKAFRNSFGEGLIRINKRHLEIAGVTEDEAFGMAHRNLSKETVIIPMADALAKLWPVTDDPYGPDEVELPMYVVTNRSSIRGAANILDKKAINEIAAARGWRGTLTVIPSSKHEMILIPSSECPMPDEVMKEMVSEVNRTAVGYEDVLIDAVYKIPLDDNDKSSVA